MNTKSSMKSVSATSLNTKSTKTSIPPNTKSAQLSITSNTNTKASNTKASNTKSSNIKLDNSFEADYFEFKRARSSRFPRIDEINYINTTHYDEVEQYLDIGYQKLKFLNLGRYPELKFIIKLFVDHNELTQLPNPQYLPLLEELTCTENKLSEIPYYPNLNFLNISHNRIIRCSQYHDSHLKYFDCSYNMGFIFDFYLPKCTQLFINNNNLRSIHLSLVPKLEILDCSHNYLVSIAGAPYLLELDIQYNNIISLPQWAKLSILTANNNRLRFMLSYPCLTTAIVSYNILVKIDDQISLKKIIANNNDIRTVGAMPKLEIIDFSCNQLKSIGLPSKAEFVSLQFNPLTTLTIDNESTYSIKELQVNFDTYVYIYGKYYSYFDAVDIKINKEKLLDKLELINGVFNKKIIDNIYIRFNEINFGDREQDLFKITEYAIREYMSSAKNTSLSSNDGFKSLFNSLKTIYHEVIVITLYFNHYMMDVIQNSETRENTCTPLDV